MTVAPRESDTNFLPCPWCGDIPETAKATTSERWRLWHRCPFVGFMQIDWRDNIATLETIWNHRPSGD